MYDLPSENEGGIVQDICGSDAVFRDCKLSIV